nr:MAG TPA: hypothetical protein [Crassvirales sp.]
MFDSCCTAKVSIVFRLAKSMLLFTTKKPLTLADKRNLLNNLTKQRKILR